MTVVIFGIGVSCYALSQICLWRGVKQAGWTLLVTSIMFNFAGVMLALAQIQEQPQ